MTESYEFSCELMRMYHKINYFLQADLKELIDREHKRIDDLDENQPKDGAKATDAK